MRSTGRTSGRSTNSPSARRSTSLAAHLASYTAAGALDEIIPAPAPFADLAAAVGAAPRTVDDAVLAAAMARLGLPPRAPAAGSELVRLWQPAGDALVGLLLDGSEPLPRVGGGTLELRTVADAPIPIALLQGASGTRSLILFRDGPAAFKAIAPQTLRFVAGGEWIAADGSSQVDHATLALAVPARPAFLEPDAPP